MFFIDDGRDSPGLCNVAHVMKACCKETSWNPLSVIKHDGIGQVFAHPHIYLAVNVVQGIGGEEAFKESVVDVERSRIGHSIEKLLWKAFKFSSQLCVFIVSKLGKSP